MQDIFRGRRTSFSCRGCSWRGSRVPPPTGSSPTARNGSLHTKSNFYKLVSYLMFFFFSFIISHVYPGLHYRRLTRTGSGYSTQKWQKLKNEQTHFKFNIYFINKILICNTANADSQHCLCTICTYKWCITGISLTGITSNNTIFR